MTAIGITAPGSTARAATRLRLTARGRRVLVARRGAARGRSRSRFAIVERRCGTRVPRRRERRRSRSRTSRSSSGESLWSIAEEVAPSADPRDVVDDDRAAQRARRRDVSAGSAPRDPGEYDRTLTPCRSALIARAPTHGTGDRSPRRPARSATTCAGRRPTAPRRLHVPVALNVNENTHPIPEDVARRHPGCRRAAPCATSIATPTASSPSCARGSPTTSGHGLTRDADLGGERLERGAPARPAGLRRSRAHGARLRAHLLDVSAASPRGTGATWIAGARDRTTSRVDAGDRGRPGRPSAAPDVVFLCSPNNPTGTPLPLDVIEAVYDAHRRHRRRRRGVRRSSRRASEPLGAHPAPGPRAARRLAHDEQGVRVRGCPRRLPRRRPGRRSTRCGSCACRTTCQRADAGGCDRGARARARRCCAMVDEIVAPARPHARRRSPALGYDAVRVVDELRAVRRSRRSRRDLAGAATSAAC